jgi:hypothetical protein
MEQLQQYPAWHNAVVGGAAGAVSRMATAAIDTPNPVSERKHHGDVA